MNPIDWFFVNSPKIMHWFELLLYLIGLGVSLWAYRQSRKRGYLLLGLYVFFCICTLSVLPAIGRAIRQRWHSQHELSPEAREQFQREYETLYQKYYPSAPSAMTLKVSFPLGTIILVSGIWVLARRESRGSAEPIGAADTTQRGVADLAFGVNS
jgi:hypothetical protein